MSAFLDDHAENLKNVEYAYEFGRNERELEIIKLLEGTYSIALEKNEFDLLDFLIALIKGENK